MIGVDNAEFDQRLEQHASQGLIVPFLDTAFLKVYSRHQYDTTNNQQIYNTLARWQEAISANLRRANVDMIEYQKSIPFQMFSTSTLQERTLLEELLTTFGSINQFQSLDNAETRNQWNLDNLYHRKFTTRIQGLQMNIGSNNRHRNGDEKLNTDYFVSMEVDPTLISKNLPSFQTASADMQTAGTRAAYRPTTSTIATPVPVKK